MIVMSGPVLPAASPDVGAPREGAGPPQADDGEEGGGTSQKPGRELTDFITGCLTEYQCKKKYDWPVV